MVTEGKRTEFPRQMKVKGHYILLLVITLYGVNHFVFERLLFFNELISLLGFIVLFRISVRPEFRFQIPDSRIFKLVLGFLLVGFIHLILGLFIKTNWYYYLRHSSIVYSVFGFFLGYSLYESQNAFYEKTKKLIYGYGLLSFAIGKPGLVDRNAFSFWPILLQRNWQFLPVMLLVVLLVLYLVSFTSLTVAIIIIVLFFFLWVRQYLVVQLIFGIAVVAFVALFFISGPYLELYKVNSSLLFGDVQFVYDQHPWFNLDQNSSWRLIFWYRTVVEMFPENLLGVGLGTPLLPYRTGAFTTDLIYSDEHIAHVIGTHNTFITIFVRLGIFPIIVLLLIYHFILKDFFRHKAHYLANKNDGGIFLSFFSITIVGFFNLVLESPTLASLYWVSLGFVANAIHTKQFSNQ